MIREDRWHGWIDYYAVNGDLPLLMWAMWRDVDAHTKQ
jgi:hypothetical protein